MFMRFLFVTSYVEATQNVTLVLKSDQKESS